MQAAIVHLHDAPSFRPAVAAAIWTEFWAHGEGFSVDELAALLAQAAVPDRLPLCRIAVDGERLLGTASLIDNDDASRPHLWPWLAAVWVTPQARGLGIGTALVQAMREDAARLGIATMYLGTDQPDWYARFGARFHERVRPDLVVMQLPTA